MDFIDEVRTRSGRFKNRIDHLETEEASKSALVLPFLQMLGYDIFDPTEVVPEFTADVGIKKAEKVDYALMRDGNPVILIEAKVYGSNLADAEISQLLRYFTVTDARFGILTDGISYRFFSDLDQPNVMDAKPFFEFNMLDFTEPEVDQLKRFTKDSFDLGEIVGAARELKHMTEFRRVLAEESIEPTDDFVVFMTRSAFGRSAPKRTRAQLQPVVRKAFAQFINDRIDVRLKYAREREEGQTPEADDSPAQEEQPEFVRAETDALQIVKAIVRDRVDVRRIGLRSYASYTSVLLDDSRGKVIARLRFRTEGRLSIGLFDEERSEMRASLDDLDGLYAHADALRAAVAYFITEAAEQPEEEASDDNA